MPIDHNGINWDVVESFVGYGPEHAKVVFIGMEEGAPTTLKALKDDLIRRSKRTGPFDEIQPDKKMVRTWRVMCDFMLRLEGATTTTLPSRRDYQNQKLGRFNQDCLIAELMPYPRSSTKEWPYLELGHIASYKEYMARLYHKRINLIRKIINAHEREYIICYGMSYLGYFEELLGAGTLPINGSFHCAKIGNQRIAIVPHFCSRQFNSEAQMAELYETLTGLH